jgi:hypothetical protein
MHNRGLVVLRSFLQYEEEAMNDTSSEEEQEADEALVVHPWFATVQLHAKGLVPHGSKHVNPCEPKIAVPHDRASERLEQK